MNVMLLLVRHVRLGNSLLRLGNTSVKFFIDKWSVMLAN